jgi:hypothetical protein
LFPPVLDTVLGVAGAILVFYQIAQYAQDPISTFRKVAAGVLLASVTQHVPGAGWPQAFTLMSMHIVVWAICVMMLPVLNATEST